MATQSQHDSLRRKLEEIASLENKYRICGVRFCLKREDEKITTEEVVDKVTKILERTAELEDHIEDIPFLEPTSLEETRT